MQRSVNVTSEDVAQFNEDGVVLLPSALDKDDLRQCEAAWQWSREHPSSNASGLLPESRHAFQDLCNPGALDVYRQVVEHTPLSDYAAALWGARDVWFMYEQVFHKTDGLAGRTPWHQDTSYLAVGGQHLIAFWLSFESIPAQACLEFVRGSHLGPLYNTSRFAVDDATLPIYPSDVMPRLPDIESDRASRDIVSYDVEPGDVIAFHTSTLHGGGAVDAHTPQRRTLTLRFFGDDAVVEARPGPAGPFYQDIKTLQPGERFRHERFLKVRGHE
ncbi:MAG: phytanoyl-CoA dioxygenase family protein [Proteobacteria bacterium]|nr:phytanoyl-CoA dioxygenase family protein [Pseudomonadota bacterium]